MHITLGADEEHENAFAIRVELLDPRLAILVRSAPVESPVHVALRTHEALRARVPNRIGFILHVPRKSCQGAGMSAGDR